MTDTKSICLMRAFNSAKDKNMEIRAALKKREKEHYRKMSPGRKIELAIELSELVFKLSRGIKGNGKRIQGDRKRIKRS